MLITEQTFNQNFSTSVLNLIPFTFTNEAILRCFDDPELSETIDRVEKMSERITQQINQFDWGNVDYDFQLEKSLIPVENYNDNVDPVQGIIWQYGLSSFKVGGTKLERFLPKNQHTKRKYVIEMSPITPIL